MLVGLPWNLTASPVAAARSSKKRDVEQPAISPVDHAVRHPRAVVARIEKEQRRDILTQISQVAPNLSQNPEQLCAPLEQLERTVNFSGKSQNGFTMGVGFQEGRTYVASPPRKRATMAEAAADYGKYLDKIVHAEGRKNHRPDDADQASALACVHLEYNYLHRRPERVALFERLVGLLQNPDNALGVLQDLESVPAERREDVLQEVESRVRSMRSRGVSPQNNTETLNEGGELNVMSRKLSLAGRVQRSGDNLKELEKQILDAKKALPTELKREHAMQAIEIAARYRKKDDTLADGVQRFLPAFDSLKWLTGLDVGTALVLMSDLPESNPQQVEDLSQCGEYLRSLKTLPSAVAGPALQTAFAGEEKPLYTLKRVLRSFELTGDLNGLEQARNEIESRLERGSLVGTADEWMTRLEHRLEQLTLFEPDAKKAFVRAQKEVLDSSSGGRLGQQDGYLVVGSSRLPLRLGR